jgi:hypothetical protein
MKGLLLLLLAIEVGLPLLLFALRSRLLFFPSASPRAAAEVPALADRGIEGRVVEVVRPDGRRLQAYDVRPEGAADAGPVVLFLHGNAGNIAWRAPLLAGFVRGTGARTLMPDYSGFGGNEGSPSEDEVVADGLAAYDHLRAAGVPAGRIVLYGESIGGAVAVAVAARRECAGVVLQSSFSSTSSMALRVYPWLPLAALLVRGSFRSADRVSGIRAPILVTHGTRDSIVPFDEGRALHAAAGPSAEFLPVEGADHNDFLDVAGEPFLRGLGDRFRRWTAPR